MFRWKREQNQEKKLLQAFNENRFSDIEWKLIGSCTGTQENYLLGISTLGFTFVTELFLGLLKKGYLVQDC